MEPIDLTVKKVGPDNTFQYHCFRCGECCHNVRESIMLTSWELYRLAKHLDRPIEVVIEYYTVPVFISKNTFPLFMLKTKPYGDVCVFYKNGCSIQDVKPIVCRLYPLNIEPGKYDGLDYCIVSQKPHHYTGETHSVGDWIVANLSPDDRRFMIEWFNKAIELGRAMRKIGVAPNGEEKMKRMLTTIIWLMYFCYETQEDFWPQYERNMAVLKKEMELAAKSGFC